MLDLSKEISSEVIVTTIAIIAIVIAIGVIIVKQKAKL